MTGVHKRDLLFNETGTGCAKKNKQDPSWKKSALNGR